MPVSLAENQIPKPQALPIDEPIEFGNDMREFLDVFEAGNRSEIVENARSRMVFLLGHATRIDDEVTFSAELDFPLSADGAQKMGEVREAIGEDFISALTEYYKDLERRADSLIHEIQLQGVNYFVDNKGRYYDATVAEIEEILNKMRYGYEVVNNEKLERLSSAYRQINIQAEFEEGFVPPEGEKLSADAVEFDHENREIDQIFKMLEDGNGSTEEIMHRMLRLAKSMITHMNDAIANQAGILFAECKYKRNLECLDKDALHQLEYMLDVVVRIIRVINNVRIQKNLLLGT